MSEEHAYGHRTDLMIEFENISKQELWNLYTLARKKLEQEITKSEEFVEVVRSHYGDYEPPTSDGLWVNKKEHDRIVEELKSRVKHLLSRETELKQFELEYIAWAESKYHDVEAPTYQYWLETKLESERLARIEAEKTLEFGKKFMDTLADELKETKKRLEELEDAIWFFQNMIERCNNIIIKKAIENSQARRNAFTERRLLNKAGEFIDRNGGEAMG